MNQINIFSLILLFLPEIWLENRAGLAFTQDFWNRFFSKKKSRGDSRDF